MNGAIQIVVLYLLVGFLFQFLIMHSPVKLAARLLTVVAWLPMLCFEGTPTMARFVAWATDV